MNNQLLHHDKSTNPAREVEQDNMNRRPTQLVALMKRQGGVGSYIRDMYLLYIVCHSLAPQTMYRIRDRK
jgi:hypothetical protein